jgi:DNA-directed RNA polymerase subunit RPC12/RpoP
MADAQTFGYGERVLLCPQCGAPVDARPEGGTFACKYCGTQVAVAARPVAGTAPETNAAAMSDAQRLDLLRAQADKPFLPPPELRYLMHGGQLSPDQVDAALQEWQKARSQMTTGATPAAAEGLYFLTLLLDQYYGLKNDREHERGLLETASELLTDPRYVQEIRGIMARRAADAGELDAAEKWLAPCDPRPTDLPMDSAYRVSRAYIAVRRGQWDDVLKLLGETAQEIPIADQYAAVCAVWRANAMEKLGRLDRAKTLLIQLMGAAHGPGVVERILATYRDRNLALCEQTWAALRQTAAARPKGSTAGKIGRLLGFLGAIFLLAGAVMLPLNWLRLDFLPHTGGFRTLMLVFGIIGLAWGGAMILTSFILAAVFGHSADAQRVEKTGLAGKGEILAILHTAVKINHVPQYKLEIQVTVPGKEPYTVSHRIVLPQDKLKFFQPGVTLGVKVDPKNPKNVVLEM